MITVAGSGHPGGSLSAAEIVTVLFFHTLRRRPGDATWPERDRFVISKGHGVPIVYAALAECGELAADELQTLRKLGSRLQGHPDRVMLPWVEARRSTRSTASTRPASPGRRGASSPTCAARGGGAPAEQKRTPVGLPFAIRC